MNRLVGWRAGENGRDVVVEGDGRGAGTGRTVRVLDGQRQGGADAARVDAGQGRGCGAATGGVLASGLTVLKREPIPTDYFQVPTRTWLLQAGGLDVYMVNNDLFCKACFEAKAPA